jgi:DNA-binding response OmpR family regulator
VKEAPRILVVDDDADLVKLLAIVLKRINAVCLAANDGRAGLDAIKTQQPDLVVLDLMLPDLDGFEILRQVRAQPDLARLPVLILSAKSDPITIRQGLENGADGFVTKPYRTHSLLEKITALLHAP